MRQSGLLGIFFFSFAVITHHLQTSVKYESVGLLKLVTGARIICWGGGGGGCWNVDEWVAVLCVVVCHCLCLLPWSLDIFYTDEADQTWEDLGLATEALIDHQEGPGWLLSVDDLHLSFLFVWLFLSVFICLFLCLFPSAWVSWTSKSQSNLTIKTWSWRGPWLLMQGPITTVGAWGTSPTQIPSSPRGAPPPKKKKKKKSCLLWNKMDKGNIVPQRKCKASQSAPTPLEKS